MPRSGGGVMSWPPNTVAIPNTTIESGKYNAFLADLLSDLNTPRPIVMGGTGAGTVIAAHDAFTTTGANIASAGTTDLATATGASVTITGTATITALGTLPAGVLRFLTFAGAATLTHNASSLILPGAANIVTAAGDTAVAQSLGAGNWRIWSYQKASGLPVANPSALAGPVTISSAAAGTVLTITSTDAGASAGPILESFRNSASPLAGDLIGYQSFTGNNSAAAKKIYFDFFVQILDPTAASEDSTVGLRTIIAGASNPSLTLGAGIYSGSPTGGDKGAGTVNAIGYYVNGAQIPFSAAYESAQQTITSGGTITLAHGLGVRPKLYMPFLQCVTAEAGYAIGAEIPMPQTNGVTTFAPLPMVPDATNITLRFGSSAQAFWATNFTTGAGAVGLTNANWRLVVRAWA